MAVAVTLCFASAAHAAAPGCGDKHCHGALVGRAHEHAPVKEGDCSSCHRVVPGASHPDSARAGFTLAAAGGKLCAQCHDAFGGDTRHPPADEGECLSCHDPHGGTYAALLKRPVNDTCFECHEAKSFAVHALVGVDLGTGHPLSGVPDPARKGAALSCVSCHDPHATDTPKLWKFSALSTFDLCSNCHRK